MTKFTILLLVALSGCAAQQGIVMHWSSGSANSYQYDTIMDTFPPDYSVTGDAFELSENPEKIKEAVNQLKSIQLPAHLPMLTTVRNIGDKTYEVKTISVTPVFVGEPKNDEERVERKIQEQMTGSIQLLAKMNSSGDVISYYLKQKQKNLV